MGMNELLFSEIALWIWGLWGLLALTMGYLVASSIESPDETAVAVGSVALGFGLWEALTGGGFFRGVGEALQNLILAILFIPAWPVVYLMEPSWILGKSMNLDWIGSLLVCAGIGIIGGGLLVILWVIALANIRRFLPDFIAALAAMSVFSLAPFIAALVG